MNVNWNSLIDVVSWSPWWTGDMSRFHSAVPLTSAPLVPRNGISSKNINCPILLQEQRFCRSRLRTSKSRSGHVRRVSSVSGRRQAFMYPRTSVWFSWHVYGERLSVMSRCVYIHMRFFFFFYVNTCSRFIYMLLLEHVNWSLCHRD